MRSEEGTSIETKHQRGVEMVFSGNHMGSNVRDNKSIIILGYSK